MIQYVKVLVPVAEYGPEEELHVRILEGLVVQLYQVIRTLVNIFLNGHICQR